MIAAELHVYSICVVKGGSDWYRYIDHEEVDVSHLMVINQAKSAPSPRQNRL